MNLKNKTAIVTGGTRASAAGLRSFAQRGLQVCISARHQDEIDAALKQLNSSGDAPAIGHVCDVRDYDQVKALIAFTVKELGGLDILINNAGIGIFETVEQTSPEDFRAVLETNLFGVFYCCQKRSPR
jgi:NAD(P)-dependent dehydrogenase (short-subunit alcohol dehydrogenase family)